MRYVSTRGEAPPLGFMDVTLAGLARDGGLYVPETWPRLSPETIAGFAGRPYAEVAVEVIRPFVGDTISEADLSRLAREAYGTFRHPAVVPLSQLGANTFLLELFHGPTLGVQGRGHAAPGAADGSRAGGARRAHHHRRSRPPATPAAPRSRRSAAASGSICSCCSRKGRISDVQRRMMTTAPRRQRACARGRRHVRRLPGAGEGAVQPSRASATGCGSPASTRSTGRASSRRWSTISPPRRRSARRTARSPSRCRPAISATSSRATSPQRMGLPVDRLVIATNVNDILARTLATGTYEVRERGRDLVAVDGHPGVVEFRAPAVRGLRPRRRRGPRR